MLTTHTYKYSDGLKEKRRNSIANTLELPLDYINIVAQWHHMPT